MTKEMSDSKDNEQLQFLLEEQKIAVEIYWKYSEYILFKFKFFPTLIAGVGGVLLALI